MRRAFDTVVRREPLAFAADGELRDLNRLRVGSCCIERSCVRSLLLMLIDILLSSLSMFHIVVTHHGQSFKAPLAYQTCTREATFRNPVR